MVVTEAVRAVKVTEPVKEGSGSAKLLKALSAPETERTELGLELIVGEVELLGLELGEELGLELEEDGLLEALAAVDVGLALSGAAEEPEPEVLGLELEMLELELELGEVIAADVDETGEVTALISDGPKLFFKFSLSFSPITDHAKLKRKPFSELTPL